ncbi:creatininase family protein [Naumannella huperziae]
MSVVEWAACDRATLADLLPNALVIVPLGAVEQHGIHLPTGTDFMITRALARAAADHAAESGGSFVIAPPLCIGASDHHLPFGGTLSVRAETLLTVITDLLASIAGAGATRVLLLNGHGGNSGICQAAAGAAAARSELSVTHIDYWRALDRSGEPDDPPVPGHAGAFETSIMLELRPDLVRRAPHRPDPPAATNPIVAGPGMETHSRAAWAEIDGYSDHPDRASRAAGATYWRDLITALSTRFGVLAP